MLLTRMNLEDNMLSKRSQSQKDKYSVISLEVPKVIRLTDTESRKWRMLGAGGGETGSCLMGTDYRN